jgi:hypothetical protein
MPFAVTELVTDNFESIDAVGSTFEVVYKVKSKDTNAVSLYMNYTKNLSSKIDILVKFANKWIDPADYYDELILDESSMVLEDCEMELNNAGKKRLIINNVCSEDLIKIVFTPDNLLGTDTLVLYANEDKIGGERGNTTESV